MSFTYLYYLKYVNSIDIHRLIDTNLNDKSSLTTSGFFLSLCRLRLLCPFKPDAVLWIWVVPLPLLFIIIIFVVMTNTNEILVKVLIIGESEWNDVTLPVGATVAQLALSINKTGQFRKIGGAILKPEDILENEDRLAFSAGDVTTNTDANGTTRTVMRQKKISGANRKEAADDELITVKFVETKTVREVVLPKWISIQAALEMARISHGRISLNGNLVGFGVELQDNSELVLLPSLEVPPKKTKTADKCEDCECEGDYDDEYFDF